MLTSSVLDFSSLQDINALLPGAVPPLTANETLRCSLSNGCTREVFLQELVKSRVAYQPNTTPGYTNIAFSVLGLVVEAVSNSTFHEVLDNSLLTPLNLSRTTMSAPEDLTNAVIPGNATTSGWDLPLNETHIAAMGGLFTTPNELSKIGRSILSSSLLPGSTTRAWMKPSSFTSSLVGAVGPGFEIYRAVLNAKHNRVVDLYTKGGNLPGYGANLIMIPDFNVGIVLMQAGRRSTVGTSILGMVLDDLLPALEEEARVQADAVFAGTYTANNGLNSTVKLTSTLVLPSSLPPAKAACYFCFTISMSKSRHG
jgi:CubicO group peptidase (beta-lactamase class C family)